MNDNRCIFCGEIIPEGRQVCPICEKDLEACRNLSEFIHRVERRLFLQRLEKISREIKEERDNDL